MTGIAGARARTACAQIAAVEGYADSLGDALAQAMAGIAVEGDILPGRPAVVAFCAEQGFVGGFSERVLDAVETNRAGRDLFLIGSRGAAIAAGRGLVPVWSAAMPSRSASLPKFADQVLGAVFAQGDLRAVSVVHTVWTRGRGHVERLALFPLVPEQGASLRAAPLANLPADELATSLGLDRLHALMTRAALRAFVAENEARMAAMAAASRQIDEELGVLEALARRMRQEAITSEIIEIASGAMAVR
ncbi:MAG: F0F1 ATP synthase subunit gamma [Rubellimicrobium sp.]|nr:F0F1 ATP synthase subunit gamma [Rubellimicrobium sp.]